MKNRVASAAPPVFSVKLRPRRTCRRVTECGGRDDLLVYLLTDSVARARGSIIRVTRASLFARDVYYYNALDGRHYAFFFIIVRDRAAIIIIVGQCNIRWLMTHSNVVYYHNRRRCEWA